MAKSSTKKQGGKAGTTKGKAAKKKGPPAGGQVYGWEDDPQDATPILRPVPNLGQRPLAFNFTDPASPAGTYATGTPQFRYWAAAEALRRGADFWARIAGLQAWQPGPALDVNLDVDDDLNANYDRTALNFYHGRGADGKTVYSGESPDIVCHEMGHAVLDAIKPQLWDAASQEAAAFHESFADISALLCAIQLPEFRAATIAETGGHLYRSSRLSRLAEQLGAAIRAQFPDAAEPDCLRNAVNSFSYSAPAQLPPNAPASQLSSEAHSFSRLFTGAAFEVLAALLATKAGANAPTADQLLAAGDDLARILIAGVQQAAVVSNWYAQVAAAMVQTSAQVDPAYPPLLRSVFVRRAILSLHSAAAIHQFAPAVHDAAAAAPQTPAGLPHMALPAEHLGLNRPVVVKVASEPRPFAAMAMEANESLQPPSASEAARVFVDDLFRKGRVDYDGHGVTEAMLIHGRRRRNSHRIVPHPAGYMLERQLFDCGFCP
jgi:hypothetical protein